MLAIDQQQRILFWNDTMQEILGYEAENILGRTCPHLFRACSMQGALPCRAGCHIFQQAFQGRQLPSYTIEALARDGRHVLLNVSAVLLPGPDTFAEQTVLLLFCRQLAAELCPGGKMCLHALGPLRVWRSDSSPVSGRNWQRLEVRLLLTLLAARRGEFVSEQMLKRYLWPGISTAERDQKFQITLARLCHCLEPHTPLAHSTYILHQNDRLSLTGGSLCWLDTEAFAQQIHHARLELDAVEAIKLYRRALRLYRGPFVMDLPAVAGPLRDERVRLQRLYLETLEETGLCFEKIGRIHEACWYYCLTLKADPNRMEARRLLYHLEQSAGSQNGHSVEQTFNLSQVIGDQTDRLIYGGKNLHETV